MSSCPACGEHLVDGARFCSGCGAALHQRPDERRLVTVLMADIVGFTALAETSDPETVKNLVDRCFEALVDDITSFGGHLDKIVGDQIVAQFGAPVAHEDDAERAVRAALRMRSSLDQVAAETNHRFALRIGVNTGEVLVGAMRAGGDATVMGDVVNTASRLQTAAAPGQVLVGSATYLATKDVVRYDDIGALDVKGREELVEAWSALEAIAPPGQSRRARRAPLVGRDPEMGLLRHALHLAFSRRRAQLVVLEGDAGVGKSRLASELAAEARREHAAVVLRGQCAPYGESNPWAPIAAILRDACGLDHEGPCAPNRAQIVETVRRTIPDADAADVERITDGIVLITDGTTKAGVDPRRARDDAVRSVGAFLESLAAAQPLVILLSDIHWADGSVLSAIERILRRLRSLPFLLVTSARPDIDERWATPAGHHNSLVIHVDPLDADATAELAEHLFGDELDEGLVAFFQERSGGNPFFVEELVALVCDTGIAVATGAEGLGALPVTLHGLVAARLDALAPEQRNVLEDFAVVGASGAVATALLLSGRAVGDPLLRELQDRDLLEVDDDEFRFRSELVREVAYGTLTKGERARRHAALADHLTALADEPVGLAAHHLACAAELMDEVGYAPGVPSNVRTRAVGALQRAARLADAEENFASSGRLWERTLSLLPDTPEPDRWEALLGHARALDAARSLDDARESALIALEEATSCESAEYEARALSLLGRIAADAGDYAAAEQYYGTAVTAMRALGNSTGVADALRGLGVTRLFQGEFAEAERLSSDALASFVAAGDRRGEAWAHQTLAWIAFSGGDTEAAEVRLDRAAELFEEIGDWGGVGWALGLLAFVRFNQGDLDEAEDLAQQIVLESADTGNRWGEGMMESLLAGIAVWRGRAEESVGRFKHAVAMFTEMGDVYGRQIAVGGLVRSLSMLGRFRERDDALRDLAAVSAENPDPAMARLPDLVEGAFLVEQGEGERALDVTDAAWSARDLGSRENRVAATDWVLMRSLALVQSGRHDEALELLDAAVDAHEDHAHTALGATRVLALATAGRCDDALDDAEALNAAERPGTFMDRVTTAWGVAIAHARLGHVDAAVAAVESANDIAYSTDARVVRAVASLARSEILAAVGASGAAEAENEASLALHTLGIDATGWATVFRCARVAVA